MFNLILLTNLAWPATMKDILFMYTFYFNFRLSLSNKGMLTFVRLECMVKLTELFE